MKSTHPTDDIVWRVMVVAGSNPLQTQEGGDHYKKYRIQPLEYAMVNGLDGCQHNVVKYVTRFRDKGGREDLRKARHYLELLEYFEYGADSDTRDEQRRGETTQSTTSEKSRSS